MPQHSGLADLENLVVFIVGMFWSVHPFCFAFLQHLWYCQPGSGCWKPVESMKSTLRFMTLTAIRFIHLMWVQHCLSFLFLFCILVNPLAVFVVVCMCHAMIYVTVIVQCPVSCVKHNIRISKCTLNSLCLHYTLQSFSFYYFLYCFNVCVSFVVCMCLFFFLKTHSLPL